MLSTFLMKILMVQLNGLPMFMSIITWRTIPCTTLEMLYLTHIYTNRTIMSWKFMKSTEKRLHTLMIPRHLVSRREEDMNDCIQHYIENEIGCQLPWYRIKTNLKKCTEKIQYQSFLDSYDKIARLSGFSISEKTGCLPSCKINEFTIHVRDATEIEGSQDSKFGGQFYYPGGRYIKKVYHYNYDFSSYIADVGGLVGLFLGWSMLSFYDGLKSAWKKIM